MSLKSGVRQISTKVVFLKNYLHVTQRWWEQLNPWTRALPSYLWQALANFISYGTRQAAALAYYAIFSIFPLTLLLAVIISALLGPAIAQEQIRNGLEIFLPDRTLNLFETSFSEAIQQGRRFGLIAVAGLVWAGLGLFTNVTSALDMIFRVPASRSLWKQRLMAFLMVLMLVVLVTASFVTSGVLRLFVASVLARPNSWLVIGITFLPLGIDMMVFVLLFRYVPSRYVHWDAVWPAAIFGAVGWELAKAGFDWFLDNIVNFQFVYGSIATVIVLLLWVYLIASIFLLSAEICAQINEWIVDRERHADAKKYLDSQPLPQLTIEKPAESTARTIETID